LTSFPSGPLPAMLQSAALAKGVNPQGNAVK
jgi:hypothetical protein